MRWISNSTRKLRRKNSRPRKVANRSPANPVSLRLNRGRDKARASPVHHPQQPPRWRKPRKLRRPRCDKDEPNKECRKRPAVF